MINVSAAPRRAWIPPVTVLIALVLFVLPVSDPLSGFLPDWVSLVLIYWTFALPARMGIPLAWCTGLVMDIVTFGVPGTYALSKAVLVYLARVLALRVRVYPLWQQSIIVLGLLGVEFVLLALTDLIAGDGLSGLQRWTAVVVGALLWPAVYWMLRRTRHLAHLGN